MFFGPKSLISSPMTKVKTTLIILGIIAFIAILAGCIKKRDGQTESEMKGRSIEQVFDSHRDTLLSIPGVIGAGIAKLDDKPSIMVMVIKKTPDMDKQIPRELDGYSVIIQETGPFKAMDH